VRVAYSGLKQHLAGLALKDRIHAASRGSEGGNTNSLRPYAVFHYEINWLAKMRNSQGTLD
jgi:hypothetical protein